MGNPPGISFWPHRRRKRLPLQGGFADLQGAPLPLDYDPPPTDEMAAKSGQSPALEKRRQ
jgi:hypothetical protein